MVVTRRYAASCSGDISDHWPTALCSETDGAGKLARVIDFFIDLLFSGGWTEDAGQPSWLERHTAWGRIKAWAYARYVRNLMPIEGSEPPE